MEQQLLTEQEIHELGLQALVPWLESHNFKIDYMQTDMNTVPHIFALSGKILTVIIAATAMYPHKGVVGEADKAYAMRVATQLGALCATASIGLVNVDGLPDDKSSWVRLCATVIIRQTLVDWNTFTIPIMHCEVTLWTC